MVNDQLAKKIRELRKKKNMTQYQLAERLNVSPSSIGMYEQGRREPDTIMLSKICKELNTSVNYLLGFDNSNSKREVNDVIDEFTNELRNQKCLMFKGNIMSESDRGKIADAIRIATALVIEDSQKN